MMQISNPTLRCKTISYSSTLYINTLTSYNFIQKEDIVKRPLSNTNRISSHSKNMLVLIENIRKNFKDNSIKKSLYHKTKQYNYNRDENYETIIVDKIITTNKKNQNNFKKPNKFNTKVTKSPSGKNSKFSNKEENFLEDSKFDIDKYCEDLIGIMNSSFDESPKTDKNQTKQKPVNKKPSKLNNNKLVSNPRQKIDSLNNLNNPKNYSTTTNFPNINQTYFGNVNNKEVDSLPKYSISNPIIANSNNLKYSHNSNYEAIHNNFSNNNNLINNINNNNNNIYNLNYPLNISNIYFPQNYSSNSYGVNSNLQPNNISMNSTTQPFLNPYSQYNPYMNYNQYSYTNQPNLYSNYGNNFNLSNFNYPYSSNSNINQQQNLSNQQNNQTNFFRKPKYGNNSNKK